MKSLLIGTAGWSYPDWAGAVYPSPKRRDFDPLPYLARHFDLVEINASFYRLPPLRVVESWLRRVDGFPRFRFLFKAPRSWTHPGLGAGEPEAPAAAVAELAGRLHDAGRLGAVLLQFPWSFRDAPASRARVDALLRRLEPLPAAVEVRHASFARGDWLHWLGERGALPVNVDQPALRDCLPLESATGPDAAYFRLHGRNAAAWFAASAGRDQRYDYLYAAAELDAIAARVRSAAERVATLFVVTNNHYGGQAAVNALELRAKLLEERVRVPRSLLARYPQLAEIATPDSEDGVDDDPTPPTRQGELF